jgi:N-sulfoglucosamine sulfohydrolase
MRTATTHTAAYREMKRLAKKDPEMAARLKLFDYRVPEECFYVRKDPDALNNLVDNPKYKKEVDRLRKALHDWMKKTGDPLLEVFEQRDNPEVREAYMKRVQEEADARRAKRRADRKTKRTKKNKKS